jgi:phage shock protein A
VLALVEQRLTAEIEAFFARQEVLAARYSTAEAQVQINEALSGVSEEVSGLGQAMERAEQRTEDMQARVSALDQLIDMGILETPGRAASELLQLKPGDDSSQAVEEKLEALRKELGEGS